MSTDSHDLDVDQPDHREPVAVAPAAGAAAGAASGAGGCIVPGSTGAARSSRPADVFMRRLLRLDADAPPASAAAARSAFQTSIAVATVRCLLMYIVFPFVLPAVGVASGVGPVVGLVISVVAIVAITMSIRRFWRADHSKRWHYTVVGTVVVAFMLYLIARDLLTLLT